MGVAQPASPGARALLTWLRGGRKASFSGGYFINISIIMISILEIVNGWVVVVLGRAVLWDRTRLTAAWPRLPQSNDSAITLEQKADTLLAGSSIAGAGPGWGRGPSSSAPEARACSHSVLCPDLHTIHCRLRSSLGGQQAAHHLVLVPLMLALHGDRSQCARV